MVINKKTQELIQSLMKKHPNTLLTVGALHQGKTTFKLFDARGEIPYESHVYEIASITKTFTTSLLAKYIHTGQMNLNDSIAKYIPELDERKYYPTLKRLATHTGGYKTEALTKREILKINLKAMKAATGEKRYYWSNYMDYKKMIWFAKRHKLQDKDYEHSYTNYSVSLLGQGISQMVGRPFKELMTDFIRQDLGLKQTKYGVDRRDVLTGYVGDENVGNENFKAGECDIPAHYLTSTAEDLLAFARMNMEEQPKFLGLCHEITSIDKPQYDMGLGWIFLNEKEPYSFFHDGGSEGFSSALAFTKEKDFALTILANSGMTKAGDGEMFFQLARAVLVENLEN